MSEYITFVNSYGQPCRFPKTSEALQNLKKRDPRLVLPEILELLQRIYRRSIFGRGVTINSEDLAYELNVRHTIVQRILNRLVETGLVGKLQNQKFNTYPLLRTPEDRDYYIFKEKQWQQAHR